MDFVLIDDEPIALFLTKQLFKLEGLSEKVIAFDDPEEAIKFLQRQILSGNVPHVILLDLNMPKVSGWDLLGALGPYSEQLQANCFIYLLTSSVDPTDLTRAKEHPQVKELIHKPLDKLKIHKIQEDMRSNR